MKNLSRLNWFSVSLLGGAYFCAAVLLWLNYRNVSITTRMQSLTSFATKLEQSENNIDKRVQDLSKVNESNKLIKELNETLEVTQKHRAKLQEGLSEDVSKLPTVAWTEFEKEIEKLIQESKSVSVTSELIAKFQLRLSPLELTAKDASQSAIERQSLRNSQWLSENSATLWKIVGLLVAILFGILYQNRMVKQLNERLFSQERAYSESNRLAALGGIVSSVLYDVTEPIERIEKTVTDLETAFLGESIDRDFCRRQFNELLDICRVVSSFQVDLGKILEKSMALEAPPSLKVVTEATEKVFLPKMRRYGVTLDHSRLDPALSVGCDAAALSQILGSLIAMAIPNLEKEKEKTIRLEASETGNEIRVSVQYFLHPTGETKENKSTPPYLLYVRNLVHAANGKLFLAHEPLKQHIAFTVPKPGKVVAIEQKAA